MRELSETELERNFRRLAGRVSVLLYPNELSNRVCASALGIAERLRSTFALKPKLPNIKDGWRFKDLTLTIQEIVGRLTMETLPEHTGIPADDITYLTALSRAHERFLMCRN
ncbi:MAG: hypothetical protein PHZ00_05330 [Candidatus Peribacteraceae bacterium]|nr:hypothetical protein [Candidatus Peribacteraceae bacterium]